MSETILDAVQTIVLLITILIMIWQLRLNIKVIRATLYQNALSMMFECRSDLMRIGDDYSNLFDKTDYINGISKKYGIKEYFATLKILQTFEYFFLIYESNIIGKDIWESWKSNLKIFLKPKKAREFWADVKDLSIFQKSFITLVDDIIDALNKE